MLFGFIVLFHEFGHFIAAKRCGVRVLEFAVGMGPRIFGFRKNGTLYSVRALPLGGFCSMLGEDEEEETPSAESVNQKKPIERLLIILAGPLFNFFLALFLAFLIISAKGRDDCRLVAVTPGYPAEAAGMQAGDTITSINGRRMIFFRELTQYLYFHPAEEALVTVSRGEGAEKRELSFSLTPRYDAERGAYMLGVQVKGGRTPVRGFFPRLRYAAEELRFQISSTAEALLMMARGAISVKSLTGPVGIIETIGETVDETRPYGWKAVLWNLVNIGLLLSANLGVMNLLPLPALDGGRILFCLAELVLGRSIDKKAEGYIHLAGFGLLMALMIFVLFNDIGRMIG